MPKLFSNAALGLFAAWALLGVLPSSAVAQANVDQVRAQCLEEVGKAYPDISSTDLQTVRFNLYKACMQRHGLTP